MRGRPPDMIHVAYMRFEYDIWLTRKEKKVKKDWRSDDHHAARGPRDDCRHSLRAMCSCVDHVSDHHQSTAKTAATVGGDDEASVRIPIINYICVCWSNYGMQIYKIAFRLVCVHC